MTNKKSWGIWSYHVDFPSSGGWIESSVGKYSYNELCNIAKRMCSNGEGQRYKVREYRNSF